MGRCKHKNGMLVEIGIVEHSRVITDGEMDEEGVNDPGNIIGYQYICDDCKRVFRVAGAERSPKWLQAIIYQLADARFEEQSQAD